MGALNTVTRDHVLRLQAEMAKLPQYEPKTRHYFADGMYCREVYRDAGVVIVGKVHKKEHLYIIASGRVRVTSDDGVIDVSGPSVIVSKPGTKRAVLALEPTTCLTVHRVGDMRDLDEIERDLIEPDELALFNSANEQKELVLT